MFTTRGAQAMAGPLDAERGLQREQIRARRLTAQGWRAALLCLAVPSLVGGFLFQAAHGASSSEAPRKATLPIERSNSGEKLAHLYCAGCHLFPEPDLLDKKTWNEQTLPRMRIRMGLAPEEIERHPEAGLLKATGVFPSLPLISEADWKSLADYYLQAAPEQPLPQGPRAEIGVGLDLFEVEMPKFKMPVPSTTMVKISEGERKVYMGDAQTKALGIYTFDGKPPISIELGNIPVSLSPTPRGIYLTMIGKFLPSEDPKGAFAFLERSGNRFGSPRLILTNLPRPTHAEFADLRGQGKVDF